MRYSKFMLLLCMAWCMCATTEAKETLSTTPSSVATAGMSSAAPAGMAPVASAGSSSAAVVGSSSAAGTRSSGYRLYSTTPSAGAFRSTSPLGIRSQGSMTSRSGGGSSSPIGGSTYQLHTYSSGVQHSGSGSVGSLSGKGYTGGSAVGHAGGVAPMAYIIADEEADKGNTIRRVGRDDDPGEPGYETPLGELPIWLVLLLSAGCACRRKLLEKL